VRPLIARITRRYELNLRQEAVQKRSHLENIPEQEPTHHAVANSDASALTHQVLQAPRDLVFLILAGLFLGTLGMLNILGLTRFLQLGQIGTWPIVVAGRSPADPRSSRQHACVGS